MRKYETAVIFDLDWEEEERNAFVERLESIISNFSGEVLDREDWGVRKLAYKILKKNSGHYLFLRYAGGSGVVEELERVMGLNERVLRYLTTRFEKDIKGKYPPPPPIDEFLDRDITELQTLKAQWRRGAASQPAPEGEKQTREVKEKPAEAEPEAATEEVAEAPPEAPAEERAEAAPEVPAEETAAAEPEAAAEEVAEAPPEIPAEETAEAAPEAPAEETAAEEPEAAAEEVAEAPPEAPAEEAVEAPPEETPEAPAEKENDERD